MVKILLFTLIWKPIAEMVVKFGNGVMNQFQIVQILINILF